MCVVGVNSVCASVRGGEVRAGGILCARAGGRWYAAHAAVKAAHDWYAERATVATTPKNARQRRNTNGI